MTPGVRDAWRAAWRAGAPRIQAARGRSDEARAAVRAAVEDEAVRAAVLAGASDPEVAELGGWTVDVARRARERQGLESRWVQPRTWEAAARPLYEAGATAAEIAVACGWTVRSAQTRVSELRRLDRERADAEAAERARVAAELAAEEARQQALRDARDKAIREEMRPEVLLLLSAGPRTAAALRPEVGAWRGPSAGVRQRILTALLRELEAEGRIRHEGARRGRFGRWNLADPQP